MTTQQTLAGIAYTHAYEVLEGVTIDGREAGVVSVPCCACPGGHTDGWRMGEPDTWDFTGRCLVKGGEVMEYLAIGGVLALDPNGAREVLAW